MRTVGIIVVRISVLLSLMFTWMVSVPSTVSACSCVEPQSVEAELLRSKAVFAGKVLEVKENKTLSGYMTKSVLLEVSQSWKGVTESQVIITTGQGGGDCGYDFQKGIEYLVYANPSSMYGDEDELVTIICSRTNELSAAKEDIVILGQGDMSLKQVNLEDELDGISLYVWGLGAVVLGIVGFVLWRRVRK
jgi:hypothetical protein